MRALTKHLTPKALGALLALAALAALAVTLLSHNAARADPPSGAAPVPLAQMAPADAWATPTTAVAEAGDDVTSHFTLFRDHPASGMPADVVQMMASPGHYGRNAALARAIDTANGQGWVVPGDGYLCMVLPNGTASGYAEGCTPTDLAVRDGLWVRLSGEGDGATALDTVLAPDGTTAQLGGDGPTTGQDAEGVTSASVTPGSPTPTVAQNG
jgi:hypothetical protein